MPDERKRVDEDWKTRAEEEKRRIESSMGGGAPRAAGTAPGAAAAEEPAAEPEELRREPSRISLMSLLSQLGTQALSGLGQFEDPRTGQRHLDLEMARDTIDLLSVLEEKTRGNLTAEEDSMLQDLLQQLRLVYVSVQRAAQEELMRTPPPGGEEAPAP